MKHIFKRLFGAKKDLYLCGAISADPNYKEKFMKAHKALSKAGYKVSNPVLFCGGETDWKKCMRKCLQVLSRKSYLAYIKDNYPSRGSDLELHVAFDIGVEVKTVDEWIKISTEHKDIDYGTHVYG